jgi:hypothetical protein
LSARQHADNGVLCGLFDGLAGTFLPGKQLRQNEDWAKLATCWDLIPRDAENFLLWQEYLS